MTNPEADLSNATTREPTRSGTPIVIAMLTGIVAILWVFNLVINAFGPPEPGMQLSVLNEHVAELRVLVCADPADGWAQLFGPGARIEALATGSEQSVQLLEDSSETWTLALQFLARDAPPAVLLDIQADATRQIFLRADPSGEVTLREGPALVSNVRKHKLLEVSVDGWPSRPAAKLPELPSPEQQPPGAPNSWVYGPLLGENTSEL